MHADKIGAKKKKQSFMIKPQVLTGVNCFSWNSQKLTLFIDHQMTHDKRSFSMYIFHYSCLILKYFGCVAQVK